MSDNTLQTLLDEGKFDEAKRYIESVFLGKDNDIEKKDTGLAMISGYIGALNEANDEYINVLQDAINALKEVDKSEKESDSTIKLMEVRAKLNS